METDITMIRAWVRNAKRAAVDPKTLLEVLDDINAAILGGGIQNGQIIISSAEAGGSITFGLPQGHTPLELAALNEQAIAFCNQFADPNNPNLSPRRIVRMRASFRRAKP